VIRYNITIRFGRRSRNWNGTTSGLRAFLLLAFGLGVRQLPGVDRKAEDR
jgi:hypothetical protein